MLRYCLQTTTQTTAVATTTKTKRDKVLCVEVVCAFVFMLVDVFRMLSHTLIHFSYRLTNSLYNLLLSVAAIFMPAFSHSFFSHLIRDMLQFYNLRFFPKCLCKMQNKILMQNIRKSNMQVYVVVIQANLAVLKEY